jgi:hypothetical protein
VRIDLPDLKYFAEGRQQTLLRQLEASPEWRVFNERGTIVCHQRQLHGDDWVGPMNGFYNRPEDRVQTRAVFRFADKGESYVSPLNQAGPLQGETQLTLKSSDQGIASNLSVGQKGLWFEFFEQTRNENRALTREALAWAGDFLKRVRAGQDEIEKRGYAADLMPANGVGNGKARLEIHDGIDGGVYFVTGWANPGEAGYVYLKAYNAGTGARVSQGGLDRDSNELMGWSGNPAELFYYDTNITMGGGGDHPYNARFELWFHPANGGKERKLVEVTRKVRDYVF